MTRIPLLLVTSAFSLLLLLGLSITVAAELSAHASQTGSTIARVAIDANPAGNTAASLSNIDFCARTELGSEIEVDVVVDSIPSDRPMISFQMNFLYDPQIVEVVAVDNDQLLTAGPDSSLFEFSDATPDADGDFRASALDVNTGLPNNISESGPGVVFRITLRAKNTGIADLTIAADPPNTYPAIYDDMNTVILVDNISAAAIAVGQDCPAAPAQPPVTTVPGAPDVGEVPVPTQAPLTPGQQSTAPADDTIAPDGTTVPGDATDPGDTTVPGSTPGRPDLSPIPPPAPAPALQTYAPPMCRQPPPRAPPSVPPRATRTMAPTARPQPSSSSLQPWASLRPPPADGSSSAGCMHAPDRVSRSRMPRRTEGHPPALGYVSVRNENV